MLAEQKKCTRICKFIRSHKHNKDKCDYAHSADEFKPEICKFDQCRYMFSHTKCCNRVHPFETIQEAYERVIEYTHKF